MKELLRTALVFSLAILLCGCMEQTPVKHVDELQALKGKTSADVLGLLGEPKVIDSTASNSEHIWGYYQVMVRSEVDAKPRQRTVLLVLKKHEAGYAVDEVRIP